ncbi:MAG: O-antigen ligase family protein [Vicinamibacterales bacterium]
MERATRLIVTGSAIACGAAYAAVVAASDPRVSIAAAAAFLLTFGLSRWSLPLGLVPVLLTAYLAPALLMVAFGSVDYHYLVVWMAGLGGPVLGAGDHRRWHLPASWLPPLAGWALLVAVTWPIVAGREIDFSLLAYRADTPNGLLVGPPATAVAWILSVALGHLLGILWLDLLWARFGHHRLRRAERIVMLPLLASAVLGGAAALYQALGDITWLNPGDWPSLDRAGALMLDANSFGTSAALWAPLAAVLAWRLKRPIWLGLALGAFLAAAMWATGSRTALVTTAIGMAGLVGALGRRAAIPVRTLVPIGLLVGSAAVFLLLTVGANIGGKGNPVRRLVDTLPSADELSTEGLVDVLWNRNGYGVAAGQAITEHPVAGVGIGAFNLLSTDYYYLASGGLIKPDNAQNWWRQEVVELGFAGAIFPVGFSFVVLLLVWREPSAASHGPSALVLRAALAGLGIASLFGVATQHPAVWLTFVTLVFWLAALGEPALPVATSPWQATPRAAWAAVMCIVAVGAGALVVSARGDLRVPVRALRTGFPYAYGISAAEPSDDYGELRWTAGHAVAVVPAEHAWFETTIWTLHPDVAQAPVRVRVWRQEGPVIDYQAGDARPRTRYLRVPDGATRLFLEFDASRTFGSGRGLRLAGRWLRDLPPDAPPDAVVR